MNTQEKKYFVEDLLNSIREKMTADIESGEVPENWDGIELRWWLEEIAARNATFGRRNNSRRRAYKNTIASTGL